jgi:hypothetical protein
MRDQKRELHRCVTLLAGYGLRSRIRQALSGGAASRLTQEEWEELSRIRGRTRPFNHRTHRPRPLKDRKSKEGGIKFNQRSRGVFSE